MGGIWRLECLKIYGELAEMVKGGGRDTFFSVIPGARSQFSLMQYSEEFQTHFTFNDFKRNPSPESLVRPITQLLGRTHTATAIRKVV